MKFLGFSRNNNNNGNNNNNNNKIKIPEINIIECEILNSNYVTFEYEMIQRAREAECILNQMLYNDISYAPYSNGTSNSTSHWRIKSTVNKFITKVNIPVIKIQECDDDYRDEEELEFELIHNAQEAEKLWKELLECATKIERVRSFSLHLSSSEPIICGKKTKEQSKVLELYGTLTKRKAKNFKLKSKSYSLMALNEDGHHHEHYKKRKVFDMLPKFKRSKES